jgi:antirestriction protein ArdC
MDSSQQRSVLFSRFVDQVETLRSSEGWLAWLETASKFREYSFRNQVLILAQCPDATRVAGYRVWQGLGRQVRRGEKGLAILAPSIRKTADTDDSETTSRIVGFCVVRVFDVSQTEGDDLPEISRPDVRRSDPDLYGRLIGVAARNDLVVTTTINGPNSARGWFERNMRRITIVDTYPLASQTRTLLHELGHAFDDDLSLEARADRELVAESVAFLVGSALGVELSDASTHYATSWGASSERLQALASRVLVVAKRLSDAIETGSQDRG